MTPARPVCVSVLSSLLALTWGQDSSSSPSSSFFACSSMVQGVLYGSFSLRDLFPSPITPGCSWTVENPDPTKYTLFVRFRHHGPACQAFAPVLLPLDHYLANQSCAAPVPADPELVDLCQPSGSHAFMQFDKNFVQLCLTTAPAPTATPTATPTDDPVTMEMLAFHLVEVLLINNENSSQFTCGVLCRWFEECLRSGRESEGCGITQTGCICPDADMTPPFLLTPATPNNDSAHRHTPDVLPAPPDDCCVTQTPSLHAIALVPRDVPHDSEEDDLRVKTQRPRSVDLPGLYQAQTGDPAAEEWSQWSMCSLTCGQGLQVRTRSCVASPYGTLCSGPLRESRVCNNTVTCPVHGLWEEWSPWSLCSVTCGRGSRTRTRSCVAPQHGGKTCGGPELQSKLCNIAVCPVEGQWWDWSSWSRCSVSCGGGVQHRQRRCRVSVHGWTECRGAHAETRQCSSQDCGGGGNWGSWNQWGSCSKTCDSGWQRRLRMCQGVGLQGYPCEGSGEDVRACNDRKCPAPHQMCKDEHREAVSWKSAAAGDTVYSKCPSNATGSASRRCLLDSKGVAYWGPPTFARCVSLEFRYLHLSLREHLSKGQRTLAGEGMSQIVRSLHQLMSRRRYHSGDLLFSVEILRNVTDTFKRATYVPAPDDVQKFFQVISFMLDVENRGKWEDAQQVSPGSVLLMRVVEDFIHLVGEAQKAFQSSLIITDNLMLTVQREPASAVSSDVNFPMKGRRGMKDWARSSEDKLFIPKEVFTLASEESDETSYFVIGAVLYRTLGFILPPPQSPLVVSSKVLTVTVRPPPRDTEGTVAVELSSLLNGTSDHQCVTLEYWNTEDADYWDTEGCQTLPSPSLHTKCLCSRLSTFAVLGQQPRAQVVGPSRLPSVPLMIGCGVSCTALFILLVLYAALWRFIRSERSMILLNFSVAILASNVLILLGQSHSLGRVSQVLCTITAITLHFFFLSSFCWVLAEAWQSYLAVNGNTRTRLIRKRFLCLGWGLPALVVAVSVGFTRARGYGSSSSCWLSLEGGLLYAFVGPAAVIVLVNMLIGIVIFNKLVSRDGISDKSKKQKAGPQPRGLVPKYSRCGVNSHSTLPKTIATNAMASLWSSCVVLPLLALTWMSAVLAITDRSSTLFQVLFAVFDALQGVVIISVHGALRREVQDALCGRMGVCKDDSENSPDSCKNGQTDFEKDVDLACQTVIFKEPTISGTLSRISLDDEDDPKLAGSKEVGVNLGGLPGLVAPPTLLVQAPPLGVEPQLKEVNVEQQGAPVYLCTESGLGWVGSGGGAGGLGGAERDYMVLPGRTGGLQTPPLRGEEKNVAVHDSALPATSALRLADGKALYSFASMDHLNVNLTPPCRTLRPLPAHTLHFKPHPSVRHILSGSAHRTRTLPRKLGHAHTSLSVGSLERKRVQYSELDFEKVMHTRQRHNELYHELNHPPEFHTPGPKRRDPTASSVRRERRWSISSTEGENNSSSDRTPPDDQHPCDNVRTVTFDPSCAPAEKMDKLELNQIWGTAPATTPETEGDFQTEV